MPYAALGVATIAVGLGVHWGGDALPFAARDSLGDVLWAVMIVWWVCVLMPASSLPARAGVALAICFAVEVSQLFRSPGLDAVRATSIGHLFLGSGFDPRDLVAYTVGVLAAAFIDRRWISRRLDAGA